MHQSDLVAVGPSNTALVSCRIASFNGYSPTIWSILLRRKKSQQHIPSGGMTVRNKSLKAAIATAGALLMSALINTAAKADWDGAQSCPVNQGVLKNALTSAKTADKTGFKNNFWAVVVNRGGVVCAVAYSGQSVTSQWLASRQIAAAKAFTANGLSLDVGEGGTTTLSTAQLYQFVQPSNPNVGNPLFGLEGGNVMNSLLAYRGDVNFFGTPYDPMVGARVGGTITFGGGLALVQGGRIIGGLGLSGDTACADHSVAWRTRILLGYPSDGSDALPFAKTASMTDGHPHCPNDVGTQGAK